MTAAIIRIMITIMTISMSTAFHPPLGYRTTTTTTTARNMNDDNNIETTEEQDSKKNQNPTNLILSNTDDNSDEFRAGMDGYSINRRPLSAESWDPSIDPVFNIVQSSTKNTAEGEGLEMEGRIKRFDNNIAYNNDINNDDTVEEEEEEEDGSGSSSNSRLNKIINNDNAQIDLLKRTMVTLEYDRILTALKDECQTPIGRTIVTNAMTSSSSTTSEKEQQQQKLQQQKKLNKKRIRFDASGAKIKDVTLNRKKKNGNEVKQPKLGSINTSESQTRYQAVKEIQLIIEGSIDVPIVKRTTKILTRKPDSDTTTATATTTNDDKDKKYRKPKQNKRKGGGSYNNMESNGGGGIKKLTPPPLSGTIDLTPIWDILDDYNTDGLLGGPEVLELVLAVNGMESMKDWSNELRLADDYYLQRVVTKRRRFIELPKIGNRIQIPNELTELLRTTLDERGMLDGFTFPEVGRLRDRVRELKKDVLNRIDQLLKGSTGSNEQEEEARDDGVSRMISTESFSPNSSSSSSSSTSTSPAVASSINGRIVLPIDSKYRSEIVQRKLGKVLDSSRSGRTIYVEPSTAFGVTNKLREIETQLRLEELKCWKKVTDMVLMNRDELERAAWAVGEIDVNVARFVLGMEIMDGTIPQVGGAAAGSNSVGSVVNGNDDFGIIRVKDVRHPVLLLRELREGEERRRREFGQLGGSRGGKRMRKGGGMDHSEVVGNDVELGVNGNKGLILTGPNAGGKTVILKLLGLLALMVRDGIPVPASSDGSARIDHFSPVVADIGDIQSLGDDLSTFSGHLLACREVISICSKSEEARLFSHLNDGVDDDSTNNDNKVKLIESTVPLVLLDEPGGGTDPGQGAAVARSVLEAIVESNARVCATTHAPELKGLASSDERFDVAGMEFADGLPTYRLRSGVVGESFALSVAERLGMPAPVISRAYELMDVGTRNLGELIGEAEDLRSDLRRKEMELEEAQEDMRRRKTKMMEQMAGMEQDRQTARREEAQRFGKELDEKAKVLEEIMDKLKADPSKKVIVESWRNLQYVKKDAMDVADNVPGGFIIKMQREQMKVLREEKAKVVAKAVASLNLIPLSEMDDRPEISIGDKVVICKEGSLRYKMATIIQTGGSKGKRITVGVDGISVIMTAKDLALPPKKKEKSGNRRRGKRR